MEAKIKRLKQVYACFVDRPLDGALVVETDDMSTFFVVHAVKELDDRSHEDVQFSIVAPFESPAGFAAELLAHLERDRAALAAEGAVDPALAAPFPGECHDESVAPLWRIESLIREVHRRVSDPERRIIWCLCPAQIHDPEAYADLLAGLLAMPRPHGLRLVLRDVAAAPCIAPESLDARDESVVRVAFSVSVDEIKAETARKAADERLPLATRLPSLLQMAIEDVRSGRTADAEAKYVHILQCAEPGQEGLMAIAWHELGQSSERRGDLTQARAHHERALSVVLKINALPLRYSIVSALARVASALGDRDTTEKCLVCAVTLAIAMGQRELCAEALEALGDARLAQGNSAAARDAWAPAADLRREGHDLDHERALRRKIEALDYRTSMRNGDGY